MTFDTYGLKRKCQFLEYRLLNCINLYTCVCDFILHGGGRGARDSHNNCAMCIELALLGLKQKEVDLQLKAY